MCDSFCCWFSVISLILCADMLLDKIKRAFIKFTKVSFFRCNETCRSRDEHDGTKEAMEIYSMKSMSTEKKREIEGACFNRPSKVSNNTNTSYDGLKSIVRNSNVTQNIEAEKCFVNKRDKGIVYQFRQSLWSKFCVWCRWLFFSGSQLHSASFSVVLISSYLVHLVSSSFAQLLLF